MGSNHVWLIYNKVESARNGEFIKIVCEEFNKRGFFTMLLIEENLRLFFLDSVPCLSNENKVLEQPCAVINRTQNHLLSRHIEIMGVRVFNSSLVSEICNHKMKTHQFLASVKVPFLNTELLKDNLEPTHFPLIVKPVDGKGGNGVYLVNDEIEYHAALNELKERECVLQECSSVLGVDIRVYVIGKEIIVSIKREAATGFKSNYTKGGKASIYQLSHGETRIIKRVINGMPVDFVGIDFMFHEKGIVLNEIEDAVGSRAVYALTDINIASVYVEYIIKCITARRGIVETKNYLQRSG